MRALEPGSFWRENVIAFIIAQRVLSKTDVVTETSYQNARSFKSLRSGEGLTSSINIYNREPFLVKNNNNNAL